MAQHPSSRGAAALRLLELHYAGLAVFGILLLSLAVAHPDAGILPLEPQGDAAQWLILPVALLGAAVAAAFVVAVGSDLLFGGKGPQSTGLAAGWSFEKSPLSVATVGATTLVALLASSEVLNALFEEDFAKAALGTIAVGSAISALLVGSAPFVLQAIGENSSKVTVSGLLAAAFLVLTGAFLQIFVIVLQVKLLPGRSWLTFAACAVALLVGLVVTLSTRATLREAVRNSGSSAPGPGARAAML